MDQTINEGDGSCPQWQGSLKDALLSVAAELPALQAELRRKGQVTCRPLFLRLSNLYAQLHGMERALATPVLPGLRYDSLASQLHACVGLHNSSGAGSPCRKAITEVLRKMVALNAPLWSKLEAELLQSRDPEDPVFKQLSEVAYLLTKHAR